MNRGYRLLGLLFAVVLVAAGCTKPSAPQPESATRTEAAGTEQAGAGPAGGGPITLRVFSWPWPALDAAIAAYQAKHENVRIDKVSWEQGGRTTPEIIRDMVAQGKVDVFPVIDAPTLVAANVLLPLDPYLQKDQVDLKPYGAAIDQMRFGGKLYDLPTTFQGRVMLYNVDLFREAGVAAPRAGWTWEQYREAARAITKGNGPAKTWGHSADLDEDLMRLYLSDQTGKVYEFRDYKAVEETLRFFSTMVASDQSIEPAKPRDWTKFGFLFDRAAFAQGRAGTTLMTLMDLHDNVRFGELKNIKWEIAPMPAGGPKPLGPTINVESYGIAANSPQAEVAWDFLRFMATEEGAVAMARQGLIPLYRTPAVKQAWFEQQPAPPPGTEYLLDAAWNLEPRADDGDALVNKLWGPVNNAFNRMLTGQQSWEDALAQYKQEAEQVKAGGTGR